MILELFQSKKIIALILELTHVLHEIHFQENFNQKFN